MLHALPGVPRRVTFVPAMKDVVVLLFDHQTINEPVWVPVVAEPLLVWVMSGAARVEERSPGGEWAAVHVRAGDFFLTHTRERYEMRWQTEGAEPFQVMHLYLGLPLIDRAAREVLGTEAPPVAFPDVSGARDELVRLLLDPLRRELLNERPPSAMFVLGLTQALAVHLVRRYRGPGGQRPRRNALQAYKLRRVIERMTAGLAEDFLLADLAKIAELSEFHFSRLFKHATGLSPSRYFIRLRMERARQLLRETDRSIIDIGMEVGYSSPSHFSQVFRREVGVTPSVYRQA